LDETSLTTVPTSELPKQAAEQTPLPIPEAQSVFLGGLFILALLAACYAAAEIILPIVLALVLKLVLQPVMRVLTKLHIPRSISAVLIIVLLFGSFYALGSALSVPAASWAKQLSDKLPQLQHRMDFVTAPLTGIKGFLNHADGLTTAAGPKPVTVAVAGSQLSDKLLTDTRSLVAGIGQTVLVLFFLLITGDTFLRRLVEMLPRFQDKRQAVTISQQIESDISAYLATITVMNVCVGFTTGFIMAVFKIEDPVLWGTLAFLLNYIPIIGPISGAIIFGMVGLMSSHNSMPALLPTGLYILTHLLESMLITPHFLARRFTLNPVLVILALIFWYWMWGVPGAILATPLLAITKIICDHIPSLKPIGHFMEGETKSEVEIVA
jgi:predicted PurR-regulated permease PerM